jgi:hypothetical protein
MPKTETKTKAAKQDAKAPKKPATAKGDNKKTAKSTTSKSASKSEKKAPRRNLNETVAYIYGGVLIKASHVFVFAVNNKDVSAYARENLAKYFGSSVTGRSAKCEDSEKTLAEVLAKAEEKGYSVEPGCCILKCSVNNASALLKEVTGCNVVNSFKLSDEEKEDGKKPAKTPKVKKAKKDATADENDKENEDGENEDANDGAAEDANEGDNGDAGEDADEGEGENEEPAKPVVKKQSPKKTDKGSKAKDSGKNPKKTK